jgi:hypothetical protein
MGRSVSYASGSVFVEYSHIDSDEDSLDNFQYYVEDLQENLHEAFPSMYGCEKWIGREDKAIAQNNFAYVGVSEYDGLVSIWIAPKEVDELQIGIRDAWISQIEKKFKKVARNSFGTPLIKTGTFSNGEGVFARA